MREDTMTAIKPAVRPPDEAVEQLMRVLQSPAIKNNSRRSGWFILALLDRDEKQFRRLANPDAAEAKLEAGDEVQSFVEYSALIENAVAVGVLEDEDAILRFLGWQFARIGVAFSHPEPA